MTMYTLKDKVSEKLSRLFHDPTNPSSSVERKPQPQVINYFNSLIIHKSQMQYSNSLTFGR